ncbi:DUF4349 domain-containing protein [Lysobacter terrae]
MRARLCAGLLACGWVLALGACNKQSGPESEPAVAADAAAPAPVNVAAGDAAAVSADAATADAASSDAAVGDAAASTEEAPANPPPTQVQLQSAATSQDDGERKFIRTAEVDFRVREVYSAALAIEDLAAKHGGFVVHNRISNQVEDVQKRPSGDGKLIELTTYTVRGELQVRVPSAQTQAFLRGLAEQVEFLDSRKYEAADAQFELMQRRLAYARYQDAQRAQGEAAHGPGKLGDRIEAIAARTDSQEQRDAALIEQKQFEDRVAFATIDLSLQQAPLVRSVERMDVEAVVRRAGPGFFSRLGHAMAEGWYGVLDLAIGLSRLWPLWLVLAAVVIAVRRWRKR